VHLAGKDPSYCSTVDLWTSRLNQCDEWRRKNTLRKIHGSTAQFSCCSVLSRVLRLQRYLLPLSFPRVPTLPLLDCPFTLKLRGIDRSSSCTLCLASLFCCFFLLRVLSCYSLLQLPHSAAKLKTWLFVIPDLGISQYHSTRRGAFRCTIHSMDTATD